MYDAELSLILTRERCKGAKRQTPNTINRLLTYSRQALLIMIRVTLMLAGLLDLDPHCEIVFYPGRHRGHELVHMVSHLKEQSETPI